MNALQMSQFEFVEWAPKALPPPIAQWSNMLAGMGLTYGLEPVLLAAILAQESGGKDPSVLGYDKHGHGLMQIDDRSHTTFCNAAWGKSAIRLVHLPAMNFAYAGMVLSDNLRSMKGDIWGAVAAYNAGPSAVRKALEKAGPNASHAERFAASDAVTTGGNYCRRVRSYFETFAAAILAAKRNGGVA